MFRTVGRQRSGAQSALRKKKDVVGIMKRLLFSVLFASIMAGPALAATVNYNTTGSTLSCNGVAGCVQNTSTSVTINGLTLTYNSGSGSSVVLPSIINLGNIDSTGTAASEDISGLLLTINVNSTPPGSSGALPFGAISGTISTNSSGSTLTFSPNNTTTAFGTLPGVDIAGGGQDFIYQVLNTSLGIQAPTVGNPIGQTSIQGAVSVLAAPEPAFWMLMITGFAAIGFAMRRRAFA